MDRRRSGYLRLPKRPRRLARGGALVLAGALSLVLSACGVPPSGDIGSVASSPSATATAPITSPYPAPGCPAVLVDYAGGPLLYWAPPSTVTGPAGTLPTDLCAIGFRPGEHVTLTYRPTEAPSGPAHSAGSVTANPYGAFTLPFMAVIPPCLPSGTIYTLHARGDQGSQASLRQPVVPQSSCATSGAPR